MPSFTKTSLSSFLHFATNIGLIITFHHTNRFVLTFQQCLVPFEDVDVMLYLSELYLHFFKDRFNLLVWPCIEAVVHIVTMLCSCRTDWGAISVFSRLS